MKSFGNPLSRRSVLVGGAAGAVVALLPNTAVARLARTLSKGGKLYGSGPVHVASRLSAPRVLAGTSADTAPLAARLGAYTTPDGFAHAVVASPTGVLREAFFNASGSGVSRLACFQSIVALDAFVTPDDGYQHPVVATPDGALHEIFFKPSDMHYGGILFKFAGITDLSAFYSSDDHRRHVLTAASDGVVYDVNYFPNIDRHAITGPVAAIVAVAGMHTPDDSLRHAYVARSRAITETTYDPSFNLTSRALTTMPTTIVDIAAFYSADDQFRHVIVAMSDGTLTEVFFGRTGGISSGTIAVFDGAITGIGAYYTASDALRHVLVATADGDVTEIFFKPSAGIRAKPTGAHFNAPVATLDDASPDPANVDAPTAAAVMSTSGRITGLAGTPAALFGTTTNGGAWRFTPATKWKQLLGVASSADQANAWAPKIAVDPTDLKHIIVCAVTGASESFDSGDTLTPLAYTAKAHGASTNEIIAATFARDGSLLLGTANGVVRRAPGSSTFIAPTSGNGTLTSEPVTAFATTRTTVWARTADFVLRSTTMGATFTAPSAIPTPVGFGQFSDLARYFLAATDRFAYIPFAQTVSGSPCGADFKLRIYDSTPRTWTLQAINTGANPVCMGTGLGPRPFIKSFHLADPTLSQVVGQGIQIIACAAQDVLQALGANAADGTITAWRRIAATNPAGGPLHSEVLDLNIDTRIGGRTAWVATDGGVYITTTPTTAYDFKDFSQQTWTRQVSGLHTHNIVGMAVAPLNPTLRSRVAYSTGDNDGWVRGTAAIVNQPASWQGFGGMGDANYAWCDAGVPRYALLARHNSLVRLRDFNVPVANNPGAFSMYDTTGGFSTYGAPWFAFIEAPKGAGSGKLDAVVMLPRQTVFNPGATFGAPTNGLMLVRNHDFAANPSLLTNGGAGWAIEIGALPSNTRGFYVTGRPASPIYYAWADDPANFGFYVLHMRQANTWIPVRSHLSTQLRSGPWQHGPAFINPYDSTRMYVIDEPDVMVGTFNTQTASWSFTIDTVLTALVTRLRTVRANSLVAMSFMYENPTRVAAATSDGWVFVKADAASGWVNRTSELPAPHTPIVGLGIDAEAIHVATDGRSVLRIVDYA